MLTKQNTVCMIFLLKSLLNTAAPKVKDDKKKKKKKKKLAVMEYPSFN